MAMAWALVQFCTGPMTDGIKCCVRLCALFRQEYQWQSVRGLKFWLFLDNLSICEQTIDKALTIHTELENYDAMKKNNFIWFSPHGTYQNYPLALILNLIP